MAKSETFVRPDYANGQRRIKAYVDVLRTEHRQRRDAVKKRIAELETADAKAAEEKSNA